MSPSDTMIKLDILVRDGEAFLPDGLPLPALKTLVNGQVKVPAWAFEDESLAKLLSETYTVELLPASTKVLVAVIPDKVPEQLQGFVRRLSLEEVSEEWAAEQCWVTVELKEPLTWPVTGMSRPHLSNTVCFIPSLGLEAQSLNHAYTRISERFEPRRMAFGGSVFERIYFQMPGDRWAPLERLRERAQQILDLRIRFPALLQAFGLTDWTQQLGAAQPSLFPCDSLCREEAAARLEEYTELLAVAHEVFRPQLREVTDERVQRRPGSFWAAVHHQATVVSELGLKQLVGRGAHLLFADMLCLTEEALGHFQFFSEPECQSLLAYSGGVLSFIWKYGPAICSEPTGPACGSRVLIPSLCDVCGTDLVYQTFYVDGSVPGTGAWANMCPGCFVSHGSGIGYGFGQLFVMDGSGSWELVAGQRP